MKQSNKSWRTNIVAGFAATIVITSLVLLGTGLIETSDAVMLWAGLGSVTSVILPILTKDAKATHSKSIGNDNPPPEEEEEPSAGLTG